MKRRIAGTAATLAAAGGLLFAGMSIAGGGTGGETREVADEVIVAEPITAQPKSSQARKAGGNKGKIDFYYARTATVPAEGAGIVQAIKCPSNAGQPIAGGARTSVGVVINYLSRVNPQNNKRPSRTYYVGVEDVSGTNPAGSGGLVEVQCAKGFKVGK